MSKDKKKLSNDLHLEADFNEATQLLEGKSELLDNLMDSMGDGLSVQDKHMRIIYQNKFMVDNFGAHVGELCYKIYENRDEICDGCPITEAYRTGKVTRVLRMATTKEGEKFRFENIASLLRNDRGEIVAGMELVRLVEDRERALDELRAAVEMLMQAKAVYENSSEGIMVVDHDNHIVSVNPAFESITGYSAEDVNGVNPKILSSGRQPAEFYAEMWRSLTEAGTWRGELWNRHKDGHVYALSMGIDTVLHEDGRLKQRVCIFTDITEKKLVEQRIEHMAQHDALTNLPNRALFADRLQHTMAIAKRNQSHFGLLNIDLDHFKAVNDSLGHAAGDTLLQMVAKRMCNCVRESDTVARMGGDEFAALLTSLHSRQDALLVAEKLRAALEAPFELEGQQLNISCSIGVSFYPEDGSSEDVLTQRADQAMYLAKSSGRNRICSTNTAC
ncbi:MAG: diguanylate cyclase [Geobacteraceae bacterium]|nr:diguanylate cyclase [Geobacteraceae bacterium]